MAKALHSLLNSIAGCVPEPGWARLPPAATTATRLPSIICLTTLCGAPADVAQPKADEPAWPVIQIQQRQGDDRRMR